MIFLALGFSVRGFAQARETVAPGSTPSKTSPTSSPATAWVKKGAPSCKAVKDWVKDDKEGVYFSWSENNFESCKQQMGAPIPVATYQANLRDRGNRDAYANVANLCADDPVATARYYYANQRFRDGINATTAQIAAIDAILPGAQDSRKCADRAELVGQYDNLQVCQQFEACPLEGSDEARFNSYGAEIAKSANDYDDLKEMNRQGAFCSVVDNYDANFGRFDMDNPRRFSYNFKNYSGQAQVLLDYFKAGSVIRQFGNRVAEIEAAIKNPGAWELLSATVENVCRTAKQKELLIESNYPFITGSHFQHHWKNSRQLGAVERAQLATKKQLNANREELAKMQNEFVDAGRCVQLGGYERADCGHDRLNLAIKKTPLSSELSQGPLAPAFNAQKCMIENALRRKGESDLAVTAAFNVALTVGTFGVGPATMVVRGPVAARMAAAGKGAAEVARVTEGIAATGHTAKLVVDFGANALFLGQTMMNAARICGQKAEAMKLATIEDAKALGNDKANSCVSLKYQTGNAIREFDACVMNNAMNMAFLPLNMMGVGVATQNLVKSTSNLANASAATASRSFAAATRLNDTQRISQLENQFGRTLSASQKDAILNVQRNALGSGSRFSQAPVTTKMKILREKGLSQDEAILAIRQGAGSLEDDLEITASVLAAIKSQPNNARHPMSEVAAAYARSLTSKASSLPIGAQRSELYQQAGEAYLLAAREGSAFTQSIRMQYQNAIAMFVKAGDKASVMKVLQEVERDLRVDSAFVSGYLTTMGANKPKLTKHSARNPEKYFADLAEARLYENLAQDWKALNQIARQNPTLPSTASSVAGNSAPPIRPEAYRVVQAESRPQALNSPQSFVDDFKQNGLNDATRNISETERTSFARALIGRDIPDEQAAALKRTHEIPCGPYSVNNPCNANKGLELRRAGFSEDETKQIMESGLAGGQQVAKSEPGKTGIFNFSLFGGKPKPVVAAKEDPSIVNAAPGARPVANSADSVPVPPAAGAGWKETHNFKITEPAKFDPYKGLTIPRQTLRRMTPDEIRLAGVELSAVQRARYDKEWARLATDKKIQEEYARALQRLEFNVKGKIKPNPANYADVKEAAARSMNDNVELTIEKLYRQMTSEDEWMPYMQQLIRDALVDARAMKATGEVTLTDLNLMRVLAQRARVANQQNMSAIKGDLDTDIFFNHVGNGSFIDFAFHGQDHGSLAHALQMDFARKILDANFSGGSQQFWKYVSETAVGRNIWDKMFDAGVYAKETTRPEFVNPTIIKNIFPQKFRVSTRDIEAQSRAKAEPIPRRRKVDPILLQQRSRSEDVDRIDDAVAALKRELSPKEQAAITQAHNVGRAEGRGYKDLSDEKYNMADLREKTRILRQAGFSEVEATKLMRLGITGSGGVPPNSVVLPALRQIRGRDMGDVIPAGELPKYDPKILSREENRHLGIALARSGNAKEARKFINEFNARKIDPYQEGYNDMVEASAILNPAMQRGKDAIRVAPVPTKNWEINEYVWRIDMGLGHMNVAGSPANMGAAAKENLGKWVQEVWIKSNQGASLSSGNREKVEYWARQTGMKLPGGGSK